MSMASFSIRGPASAALCGKGACAAFGTTRRRESGVVDERHFVFRSRFSAAVKLRMGEPGVVEAGCLTELVGLVPAASCTAALFSGCNKWFFPASVKYCQHRNLKRVLGVYYSTILLYLHTITRSPEE